MCSLAKIRTGGKGAEGKLSSPGNQETQFMIYLCLIIVAVVMDQILKYIVVNDLGMMNSVPVIENFFYIHCIPNDGIALGMLAGKQTVVIAITSVLMAALGIFFFLFRKKFHPFLLCAVAFIVGGGLGNIIDRIRLGYVVDFFEFRIWPYIFNLADVFVVAGCAMVLIYVLFESRFRGVKKDV